MINLVYVYNHLLITGLLQAIVGKIWPHLGRIGDAVPVCSATSVPVPRHFQGSHLQVLQAGEAGSWGTGT